MVTVGRGRRVVVAAEVLVAGAAAAARDEERRDLDAERRECIAARGDLLDDPGGAAAAAAPAAAAVVGAALPADDVEDVARGQFEVGRDLGALAALRVPDRAASSATGHDAEGPALRHGPGLDPGGDGDLSAQLGAGVRDVTGLLVGTGEAGGATGAEADGGCCRAGAVALVALGAGARPAGVRVGADGVGGTVVGLVGTLVGIDARRGERDPRAVVEEGADLGLAQRFVPDRDLVQMDGGSEGQLLDGLRDLVELVGGPVVHDQGARAGPGVTAEGAVRLDDEHGEEPVTGRGQFAGVERGAARPARKVPDPVIGRRLDDGPAVGPGAEPHHVTDVGGRRVGLLHPERHGKRGVGQVDAVRRGQRHRPRNRRRPQLPVPGAQRIRRRQRRLRTGQIVEVVIQRIERLQSSAHIGRGGGRKTSSDGGRDEKKSETNRALHELPPLGPQGEVSCLISETSERFIPLFRGPDAAPESRTRPPAEAVK